MKTIFSLALLAFIAFGTTFSFAASKTLGASACQPLDEADRQIGRGETDITSAYHTNFSIMCPVLRDNPASTVGLSALQFRVNKGDTTTRSCTAYAADGFGSTLRSVVRSVSGTGVKTFDWTTSFGGTNSSISTTYYTVRCDLGGNDFGLNLYWVEANESGTTNNKIIPGINAKAVRQEYQLHRSSTGLSGLGPFTYGTYLAEFPILRNKFTTNTTLTSASMRMYYGNASAPSGCSLTVTDNYNVPLKSVNPQQQLTTVGNKTLTWASLGVGLIAGYYNIECNLSSSDIVYSYSWAE